jgi:hypothetical protein
MNIAIVPRLSTISDSFPALKKENHYVQQDDMATFTEQSFYGGAIQGIIPEGWLDGRSVPHTRILTSRPPS